MLRVLIISNAFPTVDFPSAGSFVLTMGELLQTLGVSVEYCVREMRGRRLRDYLAYLPYFSRLMFRNFTEYDVILVHFLPYSALPVLGRLRALSNVVVHWHGSDLLDRRALYQYLHSYVRRQISPRWHHIVPSRYFARCLLEQVPQIDSKKVWIIPSGGVDTTIFKPSRGDDRRVVGAGVVTLGFASAPVFGKGFDFVLRLAKMKEQLERDWGVCIRIYVIRYPEANVKLNVPGIEWLAMRPRKLMPEFYNSVDVLLFPSRYESLGLVALEAMACGVPVVAPCAFAFPEFVVPGVSGEMYEPGNFESFLEAVHRTVRSLSVYSPRQVIIGKYDHQTVLNSYRQLLSAVTGSGEGCGAPALQTR